MANYQSAFSGSQIDAAIAKVISFDAVTPEMFGAKGDGTSDDSQAVQNALNSEKPVYAYGTYKVKDIAINNDVELFGGTFVDGGSSDYIFSFANLNYVHLENIKVDCKDAANGISISYCKKGEIINAEIKNVKSATYTNGIYINRSKDILIDRCLIHDVNNDNSSPTRGILSNRSVRTVIRDTLIYGIVSGDDGDGIQLIFDGAQDETDEGCTISGCTLYDCSKRYIKIQQRNCIVEKCKIIEAQSTIQAAESAIAVYDCDCTLKNNYINGKAPTQIAIIGTMQTDFEVFENLRIVDNTIIANSTDGNGMIITTVTAPSVPFRNIIINNNNLIAPSSGKTGVQFRNTSGVGLIICGNNFKGVASGVYFRWDTGKPNMTIDKFIVDSNSFDVVYAPVYVQYEQTYISNAVITNNAFNISTGVSGKLNIIIIANASFDRNNTVIHDNSGNGYDGWNKVGWNSVKPSSPAPPDGFIYFSRDLNAPITYYNGTWYKSDGTALS